MTLSQRQGQGALWLIPTRHTTICCRSLYVAPQALPDCCHTTPPSSHTLSRGYSQLTMSECEMCYCLNLPSLCLLLPKSFFSIMYAYYHNVTSNLPIMTFFIQLFLSQSLQKHLQGRLFSILHLR